MITMNRKKTTDKFAIKNRQAIAQGFWRMAGRGLLVGCLTFGMTAVPSISHADGYQQTISALGGYYKYNEVKADGSFFISHTGPMFGVNYVGRYHFGVTKSGLGYVGPDITLYGGSLYYHSNGTGEFTGSSHILVDVRILLAYGFKLANYHHINLLSGFSYRFTGNYDAGKISSTGASAYNRENHLGYMPFGGAYVYDDGKFLFGLAAEYDLVLGGLQSTYFQPVGVMRTGLQINTFGNTNSAKPFQTRQTVGYGARGSMTLGYNNWRVEPFFNYWDIGKSDEAVYQLACYDAVDISTRVACTGGQVVADGTGLGKLVVRYSEPANYTIEAGLKLGYIF